MRSFASLYAALDGTTSTNAKLRALAEYFRLAPAHDAAWAAYFLTGRRLTRVVRTADLRDASLEASDLPPWLFEASYEAVGDLAETIALLLPSPAKAVDESLAFWVEQRIAPLRDLDPAQVRARLIEAWSLLDREGRFLFVKLLTGALRVGVGRELVHRAVAEIAGVPVGDVAQRLTGPWQPTPAFWDVVHATHGADEPHRPYPFCLAYPLDTPPQNLGPRDAWQAEWKWDGIRVQMISRHGEVTLWSRGEELVSEQFPELVTAGRKLPPGTVLDGEIVAWPAGSDLPAPFSLLQRRLGRKQPGMAMLRDVPVRMIAYDLLEHSGSDLRAATLRTRRGELERLAASIDPSCVVISPVLHDASWEALEQARAGARERRAEGLMLKHLDSAYAAGRTRGIWWKWKIEPHRIDAVLLYAQPGSGRRASLLTDYTFGVWHDGTLVPFAKAYSGLTDAEIREMDNWIRRHTIERFGPVRHVEPAQVFELAFEAIQLSKRHRSGVAVRFPRIARWRKDKRPEDADALDALKALAEVSSR